MDPVTIALLGALLSAGVGLYEGYSNRESQKQINAQNLAAQKEQYAIETQQAQEW